MKFDQLYSSSHANLYVVTSLSGKRLIIECGMTFKRIQKALDFDFAGIEACLLSHEHADHSKGAKDIVQSGVQVYTSPGTIKALPIPRPLKNRMTGVTAGEIQHINGFSFMAFDVQHDAEQPYGYIVYCDGEFLLFVTDTNFIEARFAYPFNIVAIEASFDRSILLDRQERGKIAEVVARRLLDSHQEIHAAINYLQEFCNLHRCRQIHLIHTSVSNQNEAVTRRKFQDAFSTEVVICPNKLVP